MLADRDLGGSRLSGRPVRAAQTEMRLQTNLAKGPKKKRFPTAAPTGAREAMRKSSGAGADAACAVMSRWRPSGLKYRGRAGVDGGAGMAGGAQDKSGLAD